MMGVLEIATHRATDGDEECESDVQKKREAVTIEVVAEVVVDVGAVVVADAIVARDDESAATGPD